MIGAIIGDFVGSSYEFAPTKSYSFEMITANSDITDDTIMTIAIGDAILNNIPFASSMRYWGNKYPSPKGGYGNSFRKWLASEDPKPYNSWGNGSAMRVSPVAWAFDSIEKVLDEARLTAECTHNHPEGIKGAQATAAAIFLARQSTPKEEIKNYITTHFGYDLNFRIEDIRSWYGFDESCQGTVPQAIVCYLESRSYEDAIRLAVSLGGDSDTLGCIAGSIAEADLDYQIPRNLFDAAMNKLPLPMKKILEQFETCYP